MRGLAVLLQTLAAWRCDRRGVAAIEFAIIAPVLALMFGISVEVGRMLMVQHQFEAAVVGIARHVARYPEYEKRARDYAQPIARTIFPGDGGTYINLKVNSLIKEGGKLKDVFPGHVLFGSDPGIAWKDKVRDADYIDDETIIFVAASYTYKPLLPVVHNFPILMKKDLVILPSFGRKYVWNDGQVDDSKYVY